MAMYIHLQEGEVRDAIKHGAETWGEDCIERIEVPGVEIVGSVYTDNWGEISGASFSTRSREQRHKLMDWLLDKGIPFSVS